MHSHEIISNPISKLVRTLKSAEIIYFVRIFSFHLIQNIDKFCRLLFYRLCVCLFHSQYTKNICKVSMRKKNLNEYSHWTRMTLIKCQIAMKCGQLQSDLVAAYKTHKFTLQAHIRYSCTQMSQTPIEVLAPM